jgi:predicted transcriptional regulator with HTH domain
MYKKIDLHFRGKYLCSTNSSKTCKEAKQKYLAYLNETSPNGIILSATSQEILANPSELKANFSA